MDTISLKPMCIRQRRVVRRFLPQAEIVVNDQNANRYLLDMGAVAQRAHQRHVRSADRVHIFP
jgi:hypothetical protein